MNNYVKNIGIGNKSLEFIDKRIGDDNYRGNVSSQHNRYTMDQFREILRLLDKYAPEKSLMIIRTADISKRPENTEEERQYAMFCDEAKGAAGIGTQDAMRKNLFVDMHRMGLINRYNQDKTTTNPFKQQRVKYVSLSPLGLRFIMAKNTLEQFFIFSKAIDKLLGGFINVVLNILENNDAGLNKINIHEFMFFISAIGTNSSFSLTPQKCIELIKKYRDLSRIQKRSVVETLTTELQPEKFGGDKTSKRDFHNWKNKAQQIFYLFDQTVYFEVRDENLFLKTSKSNNSYVNKGEPKRLNRSYSEKLKYFKNHNVEKTAGFELHHVIPLSWSENIHQFKLFDKWQNMVYIDGESHAVITQNRNRNIFMEPADEDLILKDQGDSKVYLKNNENVLYQIEKQKVLLEYNKELIITTK